MKNKMSAKYIMVILAGCGLIGSCLGICVNISGNFFTPIAEELSVGRGAVSISLTIFNVVQALAGMIAVQCIDKVGFKKMIILGTAAMLAGTVLLSFCSNVWLMYLLNALRGAGSGLIGPVIATIMINYWFNKNNALMVSIVMGFSGIVGAIMSPVISSVIAASGWRIGYAACAIAILVLNLPAILLPISLRPEEQGMEPLGGVIKVKNDTDNAVHEAKKVSIIILVLVLGYTFAVAFITSLPQHFPGIAESMNFASVGSVMISICMVANTGGKLLLGILIDRIGGRKAITLYTILVAAGVCLLIVGGSGTLLLGASALVGLGYSLATVAAAMITREMFGVSNYSSVYPKVSLTTTISNAIGTSAIGFLFDASGSYTGTLIIMLVLAFCALVLMQLAYINHIKETKTA